MTALAVPTIPPLPAGYVVQLTDLQALAYACTFFLGKPMTRVIDTSGGGAIGTSLAAVSFSSASFDVDGMWSAGSPARLTVQTPGWYKIRYSVNVGTGGGVYNTAVISTTGANNPAGAGVTSSPFWGGYTDTNAAGFGWAGAAGIWPFYLYTGDYVQVQIQASAAGTSTGIVAPGAVSGAGSYFSMGYVSVI